MKFWSGSNPRLKSGVTKFFQNFGRVPTIFWENSNLYLITFQNNITKVFMQLLKWNYIYIITWLHQNLMYKGIPIIYPKLVPTCLQGAASSNLTQLLYVPFTYDSIQSYRWVMNLVVQNYNLKHSTIYLSKITAKNLKI